MFIQIQLDSFHIPGLKVKGLNGQNIMDQSEDEGIWIVIEFWPIFTIQVARVGFIQIQFNYFHFPGFK